MKRLSWRLAAAAGALLLAACGDLPHPVGGTVEYSDESFAFDYPENFIMTRTRNDSGPIYEMKIRKSAFLDDNSNSGLRRAARCYIRILEGTIQPARSVAALTRYLRSNINKGFKTGVKLTAQDIPLADTGLILARVEGEFGVKGTQTMTQNGLPVGSWDAVFPFMTSGQVSRLNGDPNGTGQVLIDCYVPTRFENLVNALTDDVARSIVRAP